jgi:exodeoxyribonuclease X
MDIKAQAVHHISYDEAMENGKKWEFVEIYMEDHRADETLIYVAHNAEFEQKFFQGAEGAKWICTYKVALKLFQDAPGHSNQVLKYYLGIADKPEHPPPHRALPDCKVTAEILFEMAKTLKFNDMIRISKEPPYLTKIGFGKHRGERFDALPHDYLEWLAKQDDMDEGVKAAVGRVLA